MPIDSHLPQNPNPSPVNGVRLFAKRLPNVDFWVKRTTLPGVSSTPPEQHNPFVAIPHPGDHAQYDELSVVFHVDENYEAYFEVHDWLRALAFPTQWEEYQRLKQRDDDNPSAQLGVKSDLVMTILDAKRNSQVVVTYVDAFPTSVSSLQLDNTVDDLVYQECTVTFRYSWFDVERSK